MISIKDALSIKKMRKAGLLLAKIFDDLKSVIVPGVTTLQIDAWVEKRLAQDGLVSEMKGYMSYGHVTCISINDEVVHGVPKKTRVIALGDLVSVDICASWQGYCADAARIYSVGTLSDEAQKLAIVANRALKKGIEKAQVGNRLSDISAAIQKEVEREGFGVVRDFAGHGIGRQMHEDPEVLNYGKPGKGPLLKEGMTFAIEPMITAGDYRVCIDNDGWTARTVDNTLAAHVEDTILITSNGPEVLTKSDTGL